MIYVRIRIEDILYSHREEITLASGNQTAKIESDIYNKRLIDVGRVTNIKDGVNLQKSQME